MYSKSRSLRRKMTENFRQVMNIDPCDKSKYDLVGRLNEEQCDMDDELCRIIQPARYYVMPVKAYRAFMLTRPGKDELAAARKAGIARLDKELWA